MPEEKRLASTRVRLPDSLEEINEYFTSRGYTDGLPIVPPTEERVARMLESARSAPGEVVATVPPAMGQATVEKVAINAVMAGCRPEYLPVVLAAIEALCEPKFNLHGIQATTNPVGPLLILNGPIRRELDVNCGSNCMGQGWRANATIGRAVRLVLLNVGGGIPGEVDKATQGYPGKYTFCFGENEEESPWEPLHVERGFPREESTVTVVGAQGTSNILELSPRVEDILLSLTYGMVNVGVNNFALGEGEPFLVLNPPQAQVLAKAGWDKERLRKHLFDRVRAPQEWFSERTRDRWRGTAREREATVPLAQRPEHYVIVVAGGPGGLHSTFIPTFGNSWAVTRGIR